MRILLYNPENDMALASDALSYTPTASAAALRRSGALLPLWWSEEGDAVLVEPQWLDTARDLCRRFSLPAIPVAAPVHADSAMPWGWSRDTRRFLASAGVAHLPDDEEIRTLRMLSHRRTSIAMLKALNIPAELMPAEFYEPSAALDAIRHMDGAVLKMPWSSSGRGVFYSRRISPVMLEKTVRDVISRQGSIIVERELDKIRDFAALYHSNGHRVEYRGLSLFSTDKNGHYTGNLLMSQPELEAELGTDTALMTQRAATVLTQLITPHYKGWLGVDMMLHRTADGNTALWPCVEVNLRMTMGVVALYVADRALSPGERGVMNVIHGNVPAGCTNLSPTGGNVSYYITGAKAHTACGAEVPSHCNTTR